VSDPLPGDPAAGLRDHPRLPARRRRSQLLGVALERFAANGYHGTSMDDVADAAGVTKPVLYQHFGSKRLLYLELLETVGQDLLDEVAERATSETHPYQQLLGGFRAYFGFVGRRTSAFQLLFGGAARQVDEEFADAVAAQEEEMATSIAELIDADVDADHRQLLGFAIVGLGEVTARHWIGSRQAAASRPALDPAESELLAVRLADLVWAGLRALPGEAGP
jgi:AcrR family transcriptional regulator